MQSKSLIKVRNKEIDFIKAIAIFLVVIGHIIVFVKPENYNTDFLFKICYSFHMPLFIFVSGVITSYSSKSNNFNSRWICKRVKRLLVPYIIWTFIYCILKNNYHIFDKLFVNPYLWFLINLFLYDLVTYFSSKFSRKYLVMALCYLIMFIIYILFPDNLIIKNFVMFYPFYFVGQNYYIKTKKYMPLSLLLYPLSMIFFTYKQYDYLISKIQIFTNYKISSKFIHGILLFYNHFIVASLGICFICYSVKKFFNQNFLNKFKQLMAYIGRYTIYIYI